MTVRKLQMRLERLEDAKALREKTKAATMRHEPSANRNEPLEIDLHAEELLETTAGMGAREIKDYQLQTVRRTMNEHLRDKGRKLVFIHGNGEECCARPSPTCCAASSPAVPVRMRRSNSTVSARRWSPYAEGGSHSRPLS